MKKKEKKKILYLESDPAGVHHKFIFHDGSESKVFNSYTDGVVCLGELLKDRNISKKTFHDAVITFLSALSIDDEPSNEKQRQPDFIFKMEIFPDAIRDYSS